MRVWRACCVFCVDWMCVFAVRVCVQTLLPAASRLGAALCALPLFCAPQTAAPGAPRPEGGHARGQAPAGGPLKPLRPRPNERARRAPSHLEVDKLAALHLQDARRDAAQKVPVVRHRDH